jgi:hypothetical protein
MEMITGEAPIIPPATAGHFGCSRRAKPAIPKPTVGAANAKLTASKPKAASLSRKQPAKQHSPTTPQTSEMPPQMARRRGLGFSGDGDGDAVMGRRIAQRVERRKSKNRRQALISSIGLRLVAQGK